MLADLSFVKSSPLGASYCEKNNACCFKVWAPIPDKLEVEIVVNANKSQAFPMTKDEEGYHYLLLPDCQPGTNYLYRFNLLNKRADPASRYQPEGVFGPSQVVAKNFSWTDDSWRGVPLEEFVIYEMHVGLFTKEGTFTAIIDYLDELKSLGITVIELMPIAQFSGSRNWGYDAVFPFAVQNSYGGPEGLRELVNACHQKGMGVILDVVYNHFGPEGNYFANFGPYFSDKYNTAWGRGINYDGAYSNHIRKYILENVLHWITEYHIDGLRLDAIQDIFDSSAHHFLLEISEACNELSGKLDKHFFLIAESSLNDIKVILPKESCGYGLHAQWNDDFHHALHSLISDEKNGHYQDFGQISQLVKAYQQGFVFSGQYSPFRKTNFGNSSEHIPPYQFVVFSQNHDQIGNHYFGQRFANDLNLRQLKLIAACVILSPYLPMIFMGEEYAESAPFHFFTDFSEKKLISAVQKGRKEEFSAIGLTGNFCPTQDESTFLQCKLQHELKLQEPHKSLWYFYKLLLKLRRENPVFKNLTKINLSVWADELKKLIFVQRENMGIKYVQILSFNPEQTILDDLPFHSWRILLSTCENANNSFVNPDSLRIPAYGFLLLELI